MMASTTNNLHGEQLELKYVPLASINPWDRNLKRHDLGGIIQSIRNHGFKDPMKYEPELNNGKGGFIEGNGRDQALKLMFSEWKSVKDEKKYPIPRGVLVDENGMWHVPVLFGVDAPSQIAAEAYGVDHNNLTLWGGDFDYLDMKRMYEDGIGELLRDIMENGGEIANLTPEMTLSLEDLNLDDFQIPINKDLGFRYVVDDLTREQAEALVEEYGRGKVETYKVMVDDE